MLVLVGSTRPAKVEGVKAALAAIATVAPEFGAAEVRGIDVGGVAPAMPVGVAATVEGARRRAAALVDEVGRWDPAQPRPDYVVGVEGGVDPLLLDGVRHLALVSWACVTDGRRWSYGAGGAILLPPDVAAAVEGGAELGSRARAPGGGAGPGAC